MSPSDHGRGSTSSWGGSRESGAIAHRERRQSLHGHLPDRRRRDEGLAVRGEPRVRGPHRHHLGRTRPNSRRSSRATTPPAFRSRFFPERLIVVGDEALQVAGCSSSGATRTRLSCSSTCTSCSTPTASSPKCGSSTTRAALLSLRADRQTKRGVLERISECARQRCSARSRGAGSPRCLRRSCRCCRPVRPSVQPLPVRGRVRQSPRSGQLGTL